MLKRSLLHNNFKIAMQSHSYLLHYTNTNTKIRKLKTEINSNIRLKAIKVLSIYIKGTHLSLYICIGLCIWLSCERIECHILQSKTILQPKNHHRSYESVWQQSAKRATCKQNTRKKIPEFIHAHNRHHQYLVPNKNRFHSMALAPHP